MPFRFFASALIGMMARLAVIAPMESTMNSAQSLITAVAPARVTQTTAMFNCGSSSSSAPSYAVALMSSSFGGRLAPVARPAPAATPPAFARPLGMAPAGTLCLRGRMATF